MLRRASGEWVDDLQELQGMFNEYYQHLFAKPNGEWNWFQTDMTFPALGTDILSKLDSLIESLEVKYALFDMKPWKAPGPDGYPAGFYQ
jgi:hypothetical protein